LWAIEEVEGSESSEGYVQYFHIRKEIKLQKFHLINWESKEN
jgi:hypothetical protein